LTCESRGDRDLGLSGGDWRLESEEVTVGETGQPMAFESFESGTRPVHYLGGRGMQTQVEMPAHSL
jgi:hypothetical protein